jgi:hypothetical protein
MAIGVTDGFTKSGSWWSWLYKASNQGQKRFSLDFSHIVLIA